MRLMAFLPLGAVFVAGLLLWAVVPWGDVLNWAASAQRGFQETMARALRAVQAGEPGAVGALCFATAAYGFVHALGPGHGKVLLGGVALASGATLRRMTALTLLSSLAQSLSAILIVGGLAMLLGLGTRQLGYVADTWLAPASSAAIAAIGLYLVIRGFRLWRQPANAACCKHAHGPDLGEAERLTSIRDAAILIGSIAMRPCTGALFLLAIALRFDVFWVGCLAVVAMGLGTASFNLLVAWSSVAARRLSVFGTAAGDDVRRVSAGLHMLGGGLVAAISLTWLVGVALPR